MPSRASKAAGAVVVCAFGFVVCAFRRWQRRERSAWARLWKRSSLTIDVFAAMRMRNGIGTAQSAATRQPREFDPARFESACTGFLIDLDGTMYTPDGLIPGAVAFHRWLVETGKPFVYLSNTGGKNSLAVQRKFLTEPYVIDDSPLALRHIFTAAEAQVPA